MGQSQSKTPFIDVTPPASEISSLVAQHWFIPLVSISTRTYDSSLVSLFMPGCNPTKFIMFSPQSEQLDRFHNRSNDEFVKQHLDQRGKLLELIYSPDGTNPMSDNEHPARHKALIVTPFTFNEYNCDQLLFPSNLPRDWYLVQLDHAPFADRVAPLPSYDAKPLMGTFRYPSNLFRLGKFDVLRFYAPCYYTNPIDNYQQLIAITFNLSLRTTSTPLLQHIQLPTLLPSFQKRVFTKKTIDSGFRPMLPMISKFELNFAGQISIQFGQEIPQILGLFPYVDILPVIPFVLYYIDFSEPNAMQRFYNRTASAVITLINYGCIINYLHKPLHIIIANAHILDQGEVPTSIELVDKMQSYGFTDVHIHFMGPFLREISSLFNQLIQQTYMNIMYSSESKLNILFHESKIIQAKYKYLVAHQQDKVVSSHGNDVSIGNGRKKNNKDDNTKKNSYYLPPGSIYPDYSVVDLNHYQPPDGSILNNLIEHYEVLNDYVGNNEISTTTTAATTTSSSNQPQSTQITSLPLNPYNPHQFLDLIQVDNIQYQNLLETVAPYQISQTLGIVNTKLLQSQQFPYRFDEKFQHINSSNPNNAQLLSSFYKSLEISTRLIDQVVPHITDYPRMGFYEYICNHTAVAPHLNIPVLVEGFGYAFTIMRDLVYDIIVKRPEFELNDEEVEEIMNARKLQIDINTELQLLLNNSSNDNGNNKRPQNTTLNDQIKNSTQNYKKEFNTQFKLHDLDYNLRQPSLTSTSLSNITHPTIEVYDYAFKNSSINTNTTTTESNQAPSQSKSITPEFNQNMIQYDSTTNSLINIKKLEPKEIAQLSLTHLIRDLPTNAQGTQLPQIHGYLPFNHNKSKISITNEDMGDRIPFVNIYQDHDRYLQSRIIMSNDAIQFYSSNPKRESLPSWNKVIVKAVVYDDTNNNNNINNENNNNEQQSQQPHQQQQQQQNHFQHITIPILLQYHLVPLVQPTTYRSAFRCQLYALLRILPYYFTHIPIIFGLYSSIGFHQHNSTSRFVKDSQDKEDNTLYPLEQFGSHELTTIDDLLDLIQIFHNIPIYIPIHIIILTNHTLPVITRTSDLFRTTTPSKISNNTVTTFGNQSNGPIVTNHIVHSNHIICTPQDHDKDGIVHTTKTIQLGAQHPVTDELRAKIKIPQHTLHNRYFTPQELTMIYHAFAKTQLGRSFDDVKQYLHIHQIPLIDLPYLYTQIELNQMQYKLNKRWSQ